MANHLLNVLYLTAVLQTLTCGCTKNSKHSQCCRDPHEPRGWGPCCPAQVLQRFLTDLSACSLEESAFALLDLVPVL